MDDRDALTGILFVLKTGIPWQMLPTEVFGVSGSSCWRRFDEWTAAGTHEAVNQTAIELGIGLGKVAQPVRVAVVGTSVSPPIDVTLEVLGRATTLRRLDEALRYAAANS